jgi:hypothetical protein
MPVMSVNVRPHAAGTAAEPVKRSHPKRISQPVIEPLPLPLPGRAV